MKVCIILGTRPEIIKLSPLIKYLDNNRHNFFVIHTNQHYSPLLDGIFFKELELPPAKYNLNIGSGNHGEQTGKMIQNIEKVLMQELPDIVFIQGDTNTVLAGALAAVKLHVKVGHIEAGLRSYFRDMPEEINRILTDHCSDYLYAPTKLAYDILRQENIPAEKIFMVGNTIVEAVSNNKQIADKKSNILNALGINSCQYFLLTLHRQETVDDKNKLISIFSGLEALHQRTNVPIIYPIHPRTQKRLAEFKISCPSGVKIIEPVGYLDFLSLESKTKLILTDSGGIQEEACILNIPCVTLRENTERPETVAVGANILAGYDAQRILQTSLNMMSIERNWQQPFGDGRTTEKIMISLN